MQHQHPDPIAVWRVVRIRDGLLLGRYISKPKALAAALQLSDQGEHYGVIKDAGFSKPDPIGVVLAMRGY
jgi:hypothetical protein